MSDNNTKYSRLTIDNRLKIEECLNEDKKLKDIAIEVGVFVNLNVSHFWLKSQSKSEPHFFLSFTIESKGG